MAKSILDYGMGPLKNPPSSSKPGGGKIIAAPPSSAGAGSGYSGEVKAPNRGGSNAINLPSGGLVGSGGGRTGGAIAGGGLAGTPTTYTGLSGEKKQGVFLDSNGQKDIGTQINDAISQGKGYQEVQDLLNQRYDKINENQGQLGKYQNDAISKAAQDYIDKGKFSEQLEYERAERESIRAAQEAAARAKVEQAVGGLNAQKGTVEQSYSDLFRQLYLDRRRAEKNLPQQMAAMGYTGGLAESSALNLQTGYRDALRQGEQQRVTTLSDIDRAITDARLTGDISIAEQAAQLAQQGLASYTDLVKNQQAQSNWNKDFTYQQAQDALSQQNWLRNMGRQELLDQLSRNDLSYNRKLEAAQYLYEKTGDASGLSILGYTPEQLGALGQSYAATERSIQQGNNNSPSPQVGPTYTDLLADRFNNGEVSNEVIIGLREAGYTRDQLEQSGYDPQLHSIMNELSQLEDTRNPGTQIYNAIMRHSQNGTLTEEQARALLKQYGLGG